MYSEVIAQINAAPQRKSQSSRLESMLAAKEKELAKIKRYKQALYQDWKDGEITHSDYRHMSEDYEQQINRLQMIVTNLLNERDELENGIDTEITFTFGTIITLCRLFMQFKHGGNKRCALIVIKAES